MLFFIGAMEDEIKSLVSMLESASIHEHAGHRIYTGILSGREVGITDAGIGKVNAAMCTQAVIDFYQPEAIINTGIAGSLDPQIHIGDLVLSTDTVEYDMDATAFGYPMGQIPQMDVFSFEADEDLRKKALLAAEAVLSDIGFFEGRVVTGDAFVNSDEERSRLRNEFGGLCCEMEGGAIAHVCHVNRIPFLIIRAISDSADNSSHVDYEIFEKKAIENSVRLSAAIAERF